MDTEKVLEQLNVALELQLRSLLQFTQASGSMFGLEVQGVAEKMWTFAQHELEDTRLLVEKITALGGDPTTKVGELKWEPDPGQGARPPDRDGGRGDRGAARGDPALGPGGAPPRRSST